MSTDPVPAGGDDEDELDDDEVVVTTGDDAEPESPAPPDPYIFDPADAEPAATRLDAAYAEGLGKGWSAVVDALRGGPPTPKSLTTDRPIDRALRIVVEFRLRHSMSREEPGCRLGPAESDRVAYPARIAEVPADEVALWRETATHVTHPAARARLRDLLAERRDGNVAEHADGAVAAYLELARMGVEDDGEGASATTCYLLRAWELVRRYQRWQHMPTVQTALLTYAAAELAEPVHTPGIVLPLLQAACAPPRPRQPGTSLQTDPGTPDIDDLIEQAIARYPEDYLLAETIDLARRRAPNDEARRALDERQAQLLLDGARAESGALRQHRLQVAIRMARDRGVTRVADEAVRELQRIKPEDLGLIPIRASIRLPADAYERYLDLFTKGPHWTDGLVAFLRSECPTGSYDELVRQEQEHAKTFVLGRLFRRTQLTHEGRPTWSTTSDDQDSAAEIAWIADTHAREHGRLLAQGLRRISERYELPDEDTLTGFLADAGGGHAGLNRSLARALHLFWRGEFEASVHVIVPKVEAAARVLLLELDEAIFRTQLGSDPGGYGGLHPLLSALEEQGMDPDWSYFIKWLLIGPPGANLRNDLSHGLVLDPGPVHAALALRAAALMIGLAGLADERGLLMLPRPRDVTLARLQRPVAAPYAWPTRGGAFGQLAAVLAHGVRVGGHALLEIAERLGP
jgi:hypothetical protein